MATKSRVKTDEGEEVGGWRRLPEGGAETSGRRGVGQWVDIDSSFGYIISIFTIRFGLNSVPNRF